MGTVVGGRTHLRLRLLHSGALYGLSASCRSGSDSLPVASKWKGFHQVPAFRRRQFRQLGMSTLIGRGVPSADQPTAALAIAPAPN